MVYLRRVNLAKWRTAYNAYVQLHCDDDDGDDDDDDDDDDVQEDKNTKLAESIPILFAVMHKLVDYL